MLFENLFIDLFYDNLATGGSRDWCNFVVSRRGFTIIAAFVIIVVDIIRKKNI